MKPKAFAPNCYYLEDLKNAGAVRIVGRTAFVGTKMTLDWSASGILLNVRSAGECLEIVHESNYAMDIAVQADGGEPFRILTEGEGTFQIPLEAGEHTLSILKDTEIPILAGNFSFWKELHFSGEFLPAPPEKPLYVEVIGDSIACGDGALGAFTPGVNYALADHSARASFAFVALELLGADYSFVTRGGIGILRARDEFQRRMKDIYEYVSPYHNRELRYDFSARRPDLIILELGANDGIFTIEEWVPALDALVQQVRRLNGPVPILWIGKNQVKYAAVLEYIEKNQVPDMLAMQYSYGTSGAGSPSTAKAGHPNAAEQREMGVAVAAFIQENFPCILSKTVS